VAWGKVKPGTWQAYEQVYHDEILPDTRNVRGLGSVRKGYPGSQRIVMTITQAARKESARLS
jgi:hypothetical protein